jgi:hypothetical protein
MSGLIAHGQHANPGQLEVPLLDSFYGRISATNPLHFIHEGAIFFFCLLHVIQKLCVLSSDSGKVLGTVALTPGTGLE